MTYTTRRARIEAEKAEALALRSRRNKKFSMGLAGLATAASATVFGMAPANAALEDTPAQASSTSSSSAGTYTVQAGDTLSSIANSQGVSVDELLSANDLSASSTIYPGDVLQLSGGSSQAASQDAEVGPEAGNQDAEVGPEAGNQDAEVGPEAGNTENTGETAVETSQTDGGSSHIQTASATYSTASATGSKAAAIDKATEIVNSGATYRLGANGPNQYDCSSLTQTAFASAGIDIPRVSADQYAQAPAHDSLSNVQPGDLVFWSNNGSSSGIYHVAVYIGDGQIAQARNPQAGISIDSLDHYKQYNPPMNSVARY